MVRMLGVVVIQLFLGLPLAVPAPGPGHQAGTQESKQYKTIETSDAHEVLNLVRQMAGNVTEQEMAAMTALMTLDQTSGVKVKSYARINDQVVARVVWAAIDSNKDDHLDLRELLSLSTDWGVGFKEEMQDAINYYDTDSNGAISFAEFLVLLHQPFKEGKHVTTGQTPGTTNSKSLAESIPGEEQGALQAGGERGEDTERVLFNIENLENNGKQVPNVFDSKGTERPRTARTTVVPESSLLSYASILEEATTNNNFEHSGETKKDDGLEEKEVGGFNISDKQLNGDEESIEAIPNIEENKHWLGESHENANEKEDKNEEELIEDIHKETENNEVIIETHVHTIEKELKKEMDIIQIQVDTEAEAEAEAVTTVKTTTLQTTVDEFGDQGSIEARSIGENKQKLGESHEPTNEKEGDGELIYDTHEYTGEKESKIAEDNSDDGIKEAEGKEDLEGVHEHPNDKKEKDAREAMDESHEQGTRSHQVDIDEAQTDETTELTSFQTTVSDLKLADKQMHKFKGNEHEKLVGENIEWSLKNQDSKMEDTAEQTSIEIKLFGSKAFGLQNLDPASKETRIESAGSDDEYEKDVIGEDENVEEEFNYEYNTEAEDKGLSESTTEGKGKDIVELEESQQEQEFLAQLNSQAEYNSQFDYYDYPPDNYDNYDLNTKESYDTSWSPLIEETEQQTITFQGVQHSHANDENYENMGQIQDNTKGVVDSFPHGHTTFSDGSQNLAVKENRKFLEEIQSSWPEIDFDEEDYDYNYETNKPVVETMTNLSEAPDNQFFEAKSDKLDSGLSNRASDYDIEYEDTENPGGVVQEARQLFEGVLPGPSKLRVAASSSSWAALSWEAPTLPHPIVLHHYKALCFRPEFELHHEEAATEGPETEVVVGGLEMGTMYICEVKGETSLGATRWSQEVMFHPLPSALRRLKATVDKLAMQSAHCAYQEKWTEAESTITFTSLPLSHGLGALDTSSGEWVAGAAGQYMVTWDLYSHLFRGEAIMVRLYRRRRGQPEESHSHRHYSKFGVTTGMTEYDNIREQGGRSKIISVEEGEALFLKAGTFTGEAFRINFCIHLLYAQ